MAKQPDRRAAGALEAEVLGALWAVGRPVTPADVRAEVAGGLAYTTVTTILVRLVEKGVVTRRRQGRTYIYEPSLDQAELAASRMYDVLGSGRDRAAVLTRFVGQLSAADQRALSAALLRRGRRRNG